MVRCAPSSDQDGKSSCNWEIWLFDFSAGALAEFWALRKFEDL